jgi:hypothetical protein
MVERNQLPSVSHIDPLRELAPQFIEGHAEVNRLKPSGIAATERGAAHPSRAGTRRQAASGDHH